MILEKQKESHVLGDGNSQDSIAMSLDLDSAQILMQMLSKNLYSDAIGSTIREYSANALDSHRKAGVDTPIIVSFKQSEHNNFEFCVEDRGVGLDYNDVNNILSKYGKSTKRESNTELGMFGLGFKVGLAYTSSIYFICRKDGMERKYMMYEGEDSNTIDLLYEKETEEPNGVKIIVPVKYNDRWQFIEKIKEQLCYFENVYFDVPLSNEINNDFTIFREEDFQYSEMSTDKYLHICLDNVYYPLDFTKLELPYIQAPIALRFSLNDGVFPTPNREQLRYTQEAKIIIKNKLIKVSNYFVEKYNKNIESNNIADVINYLETNSTYLKVGKIDLNLAPFLKLATISVNYPKLNLNNLDFNTLYPNIKHNILSGIVDLKYNLSNNRITSNNNNCYYEFNLKKLFNDKIVVYSFKENFNLIKKEYLKSLHHKDQIVLFVKESSPLKLRAKYSYDIKSYYHLLYLKHIPKDKWRNVIKDYQYIVSLIKEKFIDLDAMKIPKEFLDARKKQKVYTASTSPRRIKLQGEITCKKATHLYRYVNGKNCKFVPEIYKLEELHKAKHLKVYTHHDNALKLDKLYEITNKQKIEFITLSDRELKVVDQLKIHNLMPYNTFMEGKNAPFKRIVTAILINDLYYEYKTIFNKMSFVKEISDDLEKKLKLLNDYKNLNYHSYGSSEIKEAMLEVASNNNLYDYTVYPEYLQMKELLNKLYFLETVCDKANYGSNEELIRITVDLFKYHKHKVNLDKYSIKINEEVITEEVLADLI